MKLNYIQILFYIMMAGYFVFHRDRAAKKAYKRMEEESKARMIKKDIKMQLLEGVPILQQIKDADFQTYKELSGRGELLIMEIPPAEGADYGFNIIYDLMTDPYIAAKSVIDPDENFFRYKFERYNRTNELEILAEMEALLNSILSSPTKIIQKNGLFNWKYEFYCRKENEWALISKYKMPKRFGAPPIPDRMKEYYSPKLL